MSPREFTFPKSRRLLQRRDFARVGNRGKKLAGKFLYIDLLETTIHTGRLGITVTKRFGDSPERNRFKRIVREAYRLAQKRLPEGYDLIVKPRPYAKNASMQDIQGELEGLLMRYDTQVGDSQS